MRANSRDSLTTPSTDMSTFVDYRKGVGELENSRFWTTRLLLVIKPFWWSNSFWNVNKKTHHSRFSILSKPYIFNSTDLICMLSCESHFSKPLCNNLNFFAFLWISLHFPAFLCVSLHFFAFYTLYFRTIWRSVPSSYGRHFLDGNDKANAKAMHHLALPAQKVTHRP